MRGRAGVALARACTRRRLLRGCADGGFSLLERVSNFFDFNGGFVCSGVGREQLKEFVPFHIISYHFNRLESKNLDLLHKSNNLSSPNTRTHPPQAQPQNPPSPPKNTHTRWEAPSTVQMAQQPSR
jgi:hypothetical protein